MIKFSPVLINIKFEITIAPSYISIKRPLGSLKLYDMRGECSAEIVPDIIGGCIELMISNNEKQALLWIHGTGYKLPNDATEKIIEVIKRDMEDLKKIYSKEPFINIIEAIIKRLK